MLRVLRRRSSLPISIFHQYRQFHLFSDCQHYSLIQSLHKFGQMYNCWLRQIHTLNECRYSFRFSFSHSPVSIVPRSECTGQVYYSTLLQWWPMIALRLDVILVDDFVIYVLLSQRAFLNNSYSLGYVFRGFILFPMPALELNFLVSTRVTTALFPEKMLVLCVSWLCTLSIRKEAMEPWPTDWISPNLLGHYRRPGLNDDYHALTTWLSYIQLSELEPLSLSRMRWTSTKTIKRSVTFR